MENVASARVCAACKKPMFPLARKRLKNNTRIRGSTGGGPSAVTRLNYGLNARVGKLLKERHLKKDPGTAPPTRPAADPRSPRMNAAASSSSIEPPAQTQPRGAQAPASAAPPAGPATATRTAQAQWTRTMSASEATAMPPVRKQFSADSAGRREPVLADSARFTEAGVPHPEPGFGSVEAEHRYAQLHQRSSRFSAVGVMAGVLAGGAAAGVVLAWWLIQPIGNKPVVPRELSTMKAPAAVSSTGTAVGVYPGVNPSELPYDGKPAAQADEATGPAQPTANAVESPLAGESLAEAAKRAVADDDVPTAPPATAMPTQPTQPTQQAALASPADRSAVPALASPADRSAVPVKPEAVKPVEKKVANAVPKPRPRARTDKEIERIKQQAAEELKKKTENRLSTAKRTAKRTAKGAVTTAKAQAQQMDRPHANQEGDDKTAAASRPPSRRAMFDRCEHASNLFARERCKWEVCGGLWGKQGCPSYERQASAY
jgi:hypothetical protein